MNTFGKTIRLFFVDGTPNSLTTAELSNWTGIGIRVPRIKVREFSNRTEFRKPGVYILIGKGDNNEDAAYIGEAEVIADRLTSHIANKEFWNEVLFFGSKDQYLNKAGVKYLENRLYELAIHAERYTINQNIPTRPELSEAEQAELEEFLSNVKILTASLGHKIFESVEETIEQNENHQLVLSCKNGAGANAQGSPSTEGFVVYKDSLLMVTEQPSLNDGIVSERNKMISDGILLLENGFYKLAKDYIFNSSSRAASATLARSASGPLEWKTEAGIQLKYLEI
ncbi:GIY-YIG nuclease family protein [Chryseobacterium sp.]|uniref:GIY-YIG nuclease family protein n=1 Tax=Chryseobacterium sp. TaxID=1871047 RepID=UPI0028A0A807|nr:GIY-YIG nuclease family protein [Chryseobacterium sp.]